MRILILFLIFISNVISGQFSKRYTDSLFAFEQVVTDEIYATAPELNVPYTIESLTHLEDLTFHLFTPRDDTLTYRPLLITVHGGAFITGNKEHDDMLEFCKIFASRGYITATIQYRIGMNIFDNNSSERAERVSSLGAKR